MCVFPRRLSILVFFVPTPVWTHFSTLPTPLHLTECTEYTSRLELTEALPKNKKRKENTTSKPSVRLGSMTSKDALRGTYAEKREWQHVSLIQLSLPLPLSSSSALLLCVSRSSLSFVSIVHAHFQKQTYLFNITITRLTRDKALETNVSLSVARLSLRHNSWFFFCSIY